MKNYLLSFFLLLILTPSVLGQYTAAVRYGSGVPTHTPSTSKKESIKYIDTATGEEYIYQNGVWVKTSNTVYSTPVSNVLATNNAAILRNKFVTDTSGNKYFIDALGTSTINGDIFTGSNLSSIPSVLKIGGKFRLINSTDTMEVTKVTATTFNADVIRGYVGSKPPTFLISGSNRVNLKNAVWRNPNVSVNSGETVDFVYKYGDYNPIKDFLTVEDFGAKGDSLTVCNAAFQKAVDYAISKGIYNIYIDFSRNQIYKITQKINFPVSGSWAITGINNNSGVLNDAVSGYIMGEGIETIFDIGNSQPMTVSVGLTVKNINMRSSNAPGLPCQVGIRITQTLNGPMRAVTFDHCNFQLFRYGIYIDGGNPSYTTVADVNIKSCTFNKNFNFGYYSYSNTVGFTFVDNMSENGGRIGGNISSNVNISNNLLEGQKNSINIKSTLGNYEIVNNYFENDYLYASGDTGAISVISSSPNGRLKVLNNYVYGANDQDRFLAASSISVEADYMQSWFQLANRSFTNSSKVPNQFTIDTTNFKSSSIILKENSLIAQLDKSNIADTIVNPSLDFTLPKTQETPYGTKNGATYTSPRYIWFANGDYKKDDIVLITILGKFNKNRAGRVIETVLYSDGFSYIDEQANNISSLAEEGNKYNNYVFAYKVPKNTTNLYILLRPFFDLGASATEAEGFDIADAYLTVRRAVNTPVSKLVKIGAFMKNATNSILRTGRATLVGGTITVTDASITANSKIVCTVTTAGGTQGFLRVTRSAGVSFTITSSSVTETSVVDYYITE